MLDFPRVLEALAGMCQTEMGRERARSLVPDTDAGRVRAELERVAEAVALPEEPPLFEVKDVRPLLAQLRAQGALAGAELLAVRQACAGVRLCRDFLNRHREELHRVWPVVQGLVPEPQLEREIDAAIDESGGVRDSATPELREIRTRLRRRRNALVERLEKLAAANPGWFSGGVTVRGDRFVLPLAQDRRGRLPGVVHASSGTGQTLFVEPLEAVGDGNELQELHDAEAEEVARILRALSRLVAGRAEELARTMDATGVLDLLCARRRFARRYDCCRPEVSDDGSVAIVQGRHPLLLQRRHEVVPLSFRFPDGASVVLISGPNAGGKTVVLKTVGLLGLMAAAGCYLPAGAGTRLPVYSRVFADIGDEQSLDSDLSSFTAHLGRLREIVEQADERSLVLVDEIGSSTAPEEGAALAIAVLETLRDRKVKAVATTHFGTLKMFAQDEPGMANAAMEFKGGPTYRLLMGMPGESSAFEIAEQAGLPEAVLARARQRIGREWLDLAAKLKALDAELERARTASRQTELSRTEAEKLRREYEEKSAELGRFAARERERLRAEEERFLREKRREVENLVRRIREQQADKASVVEAKAHIEEQLERVAAAPEAEPEPEAVPLAAWGPGDVVESRTFRRQGTVVEVEGERVTVAFGQIRLQVAASDLVPVSAERRRPEPAPVIQEPYHFEPRLNVRGMTREEADEALGRFLDEAGASGVVELFILHGKGTGALRQLLWQRLRRDPRVEKVKLGEAAEGGSGVTLVTLKTAT